MGQPFTGTQGYLFGMDVTDPLLKTPQNTAEYGWYGRTLNSLMPLLGERYGTKNLQAVCSERKDQCAMNFWQIYGLCHCRTSHDSAKGRRLSGYETV